MNKLQKISKMICDTDYRFNILSSIGLYNNMDDEMFLRRKYKSVFGKEINLENPETFSEKIQWLKLYDRNPKYIEMVDKCAAKKYVSSIIGEEYIIPTIGVWEKFEDIDFTILPNSFVLKTTHDSGGVILCKDKTKFDKNNARKKLNKSLKRNFYLESREWPYKNVQPKILAEQYMVDESGYELKDYKFFCFNGNVKALFVASDRQGKEETKFDFFDEKFKPLQIINGHPNSRKIIEKPLKFDEMILLAEKLSKDIPHVRVDFYEIEGKIYFGELTFYHWSGLVPFNPPEWDKTFGDWITLPPKLKY